MTGPLDDIPVIVPQDGNLDLLSTVPTSVRDDVALALAGSRSYRDQEQATVSTKVPVAWLAQMDAIRDMPGTKVPRGLWPTRSDFLRYCFLLGLREARHLAARINNAEADDLEDDLAARVVVETSSNKIAQRAEIMNAAKKSLDIIGDAVETMMAVGEIVEAANMIVEWINRSRDQRSPFWLGFFERLLLNNDKTREALSRLVREGIIVDESIVDFAERTGLLDASSDELEDYFAGNSRPRSSYSRGARNNLQAGV